MKIALVGIGKIARDQHVPALAASSDRDLVATCSNHGAVKGIEAETDSHKLTLPDGGARLRIDGQESASGQNNAQAGEYPKLYAAMAALVAHSGIDMDLAPLRHVADAFMLARHRRAVRLVVPS